VRNLIKLFCIGQDNKTGDFMKRTAFLALALLALMAVGVYAQTEADFVVIVRPNGISVAITDYKGSATTVNIPEKIKNLPVTMIESGAFSDYTKITSVVIPKGVIYIEGSAFDGCTGLTSVTIPNSVTKIGSYVFQDCSSLTSVTFAGSITSSGFNEYAFLGQGDIRDKFFAAGGGAGTYTRPAGGTTWTKGATVAAANPEADFTVTAVGNGISITGYKGSVLAVIIPDKIQNKPVTVIGSSVFRTQNITSVIIPSSVTEINQSAFSTCKELTSVTIPDSVTKMGGYVFSNCSSLTSVTFGGANTVFSANDFPNGRDLLTKYKAGGAGTYTLTGETWTKK
jgi:hypothetical protein